MKKFIERLNRAVSRNYRPEDPMILPLAQKALDHEFDVLGSGWTKCYYGMTAPGYEGCNYSEPEYTYAQMRRELEQTCPEQVAHMLSCEALCREFVPDYEPVFWNVCLRTGYRQKMVWAEDVPVAAVTGVDVKMPSDLSRGHQLLTLAKAWKMTGDKKYRNEVFAQILDWLSVNPCYYGPCWRNGMNVSIRTLNWICAVSMLELDPEDPREARFAEIFRRAIEEHRRNIALTLECYVSHNHISAELGGIMVSSALLAEPKLADQTAYEAEAWRRLAARCMNREIGSQILDDGFDCESSTSYHAYVLEMFLLPTLIYARIRGNSTPAQMLQFLLDEKELGQNFRKVRNVALVLRGLTQPNGCIPYIEDNDAGRYVEFERCDKRKQDMQFLCCLASVLFDDCTLVPDTATQGDFLCCDALFDSWQKKDTAAYPGLRAFPDGGFYVLTDQVAHSTVRCGKISAHSGHSHNDHLSYTLAVRGGEFVVDPGTYTYTGYVPLRLEMKKAKHHNCIVVDDEETNRTCPQVPFGCACDETKARCLRFTQKDGVTEFVGEQYAYQRLPDMLTQRRSITLAPGKLTVRDDFIRLGQAPEMGQIVSYIILHPDCVPTVTGKQVTLACPEGEVKLLLDGEISLEEGIYAPNYGLRRRTWKLCIRYPRNAKSAEAVFTWDA